MKELIGKDFAFGTYERYCTSAWTDENKTHQDLYDKLKLPDYYGSNYDALDECPEDIEIKDTGLIIAFEHFDHLQHTTRQTLLNIFGRGFEVSSIDGK